MAGESVIEFEHGAALQGEDVAAGWVEPGIDFGKPSEPAHTDVVGDAREAHFVVELENGKAAGPEVAVGPGDGAEAGLELELGPGLGLGPVAGAVPDEAVVAVETVALPAVDTGSTVEKPVDKDHNQGTAGNTVDTDTIALELAQQKRPQLVTEDSHFLVDWDSVQGEEQ